MTTGWRVGPTESLKAQEEPRKPRRTQASFLFWVTPNLQLHKWRDTLQLLQVFTSIVERKFGRLNNWRFCNVPSHPAATIIDCIVHMIRAVLASGILRIFCCKASHSGGEVTSSDRKAAWSHIRRGAGTNIHALSVWREGPSTKTQGPGPASCWEAPHAAHYQSRRLKLYNGDIQENKSCIC